MSLFVFGHRTLLTHDIGEHSCDSYLGTEPRGAFYVLRSLRKAPSNLVIVATQVPRPVSCR
jgi:hypothetical protein